MGLRFVDIDRRIAQELQDYASRFRDTVLVLDDEPAIRNMLERCMVANYEVYACANADEALEVVAASKISAAVVDQNLPGMTGAEFLKTVYRTTANEHMKVVILSADPDVDEVQELVSYGKIFHFMRKPVRIKELLQTVNQAVYAHIVSIEHARVTSELERRNIELLEENAELRQRVGVRSVVSVVGSSQRMQRIYTTIEQVAPTDATVLIQGETGTGKELMARAVHDLSSRNARSFVAINCAALPESLIESELFGHEKGAFTGAQSRRQGRFEYASGGTLFIDEVGDLPASVQVKLLRVLQEGRLERLGSNKPLSVDVRIVAATHRDLEALVNEGTFREDLFYRLNVVPITLPPLRERREDIWALAMHFFEWATKKMAKQDIRLDEQARFQMEEYHWPGNVRELVNLVERMVALTPSGGVAKFVPMPIEMADEPVSSSEVAAAVGEICTLKDAVTRVERQAIAAAMRRADGNKTHAAKELDISRQSLLAKLAKYEM